MPAPPRRQISPPRRSSLCQPRPTTARATRRMVKMREKMRMIVTAIAIAMTAVTRRMTAMGKTAAMRRTAVMTKTVATTTTARMKRTATTRVQMRKMALTRPNPRKTKRPTPPPPSTPPSRTSQAPLRPLRPSRSRSRPPSTSPPLASTASSTWEAFLAGELPPRSLPLVVRRRECEALLREVCVFRWRRRRSAR